MIQPLFCSRALPAALALMLIVTTLFAPLLTTDALPAASASAAICTVAETTLFKLFLPIIQRSGSNLAASNGNPLGLPQPDRPHGPGSGQP